MEVLKLSQLLAVASRPSCAAQTARPYRLGVGLHRAIIRVADHTLRILIQRNNLPPYRRMLRGLQPEESPTCKPLAAPRRVFDEQKRHVPVCVHRKPFVMSEPDFKEMQ